MRTVIVSKLMRSLSLKKITFCNHVVQNNLFFFFFFILFDGRLYLMSSKEKFFRMGTVIVAKFLSFRQL